MDLFLLPLCGVKNMLGKENRKRVKKIWNDKHKEQCRKYRRKWRDKNIEYAREHDRKYYEENKEKKSKYMKDYVKDNKERIKERSKQWNREHPKQRKEYDSQYLILNREKIYAYHRKWSKTDKGRMVKQRGNVVRQARENKIINNLTSKEWVNILKEYKFKCAYCGCEFTLFNRETKDHVIPISKGGHNIKENIVPACRRCNSKKSNKIISEVKGG